MSVLDNVMTGRLTQMNSGFISQALWRGKAEREEIENREICERVIDFLEIQSIRKTRFLGFHMVLKNELSWQER